MSLEGWSFKRVFVCAHCLAKFAESGLLWAHMFAKHLPEGAT